MRKSATDAALESQPYRAVWEKIWEIERALDLFNRNIGDVHYWPLFRGPLAQRLSEVLGIHSAPSFAIHTWRVKRGVSALKTLATGADRPSRGGGSVDSILIPFSRRRPDGRIDVHSARLLREDELGRFLILNNGRHTGDDVCPHVSCNWDSVRLLARAAAFVSAPKLLAAAHRESSAIACEVAKHFGRKLTISAAALAHRCASFAIGRGLARRTIALSGAKRLFIIGRNSAPEALAACADLATSSIELQHGVIAPYNPHYHYPGCSRRIPYAPDFLLTYGPFWTEDVQLPAQTKTIVIGSSAGADRISSEKVQRRLIVLSQWTIGQRLAEITRELAALAPDWDIVFRPHPLEDVRRHAACFANGPSNVRVSNERDSLHALLATAQTQLGVYSTALYEGMAAGLRTIVVALPGAEHLDFNIANGDAALTRNATEIAAQLAVAPRATTTSRYYAAPAPSIAALLTSHA